MSDDPPPRSQVGHGRRHAPSLIWLIPLITVIIGAWLVWHTLAGRGPVVTITFQGAEGLVANQSHVKHKDVDMGTVTEVALSKDLSHVIVTVQMNAAATPLLTDNARFWVVKPRFFAGSITGLDTLLSGAYIEISPAAPGGKPQTSFTGLEDPPVLQSDVPGSNLLLRAPRIGSITLGSPIYYRDMAVGEVLGWDVGDMADSITIHAFVRTPFNQYVHDDSRFWNSSGLSIKLGATGVDVQLESLKALVLGGIAFDTPKREPAGANQHVAKNGQTFPLYASKEEADSASFGRKVPLVSYFQGSVAGLQVGADVVMHGLKIGVITGVSLLYDPKTDNVLAPVHYVVEPERIAGVPLGPVADTATAIDDLVKRRLRARLDSASLLTGQKQVALDFQDGGKPGVSGRAGNSFIVPVVPEASGDLVSSAGAILAKINAIPFAQIGDNLNATLKGTADIAGSGQLRDAIAALEDTLNTTRQTLQQIDAGIQPAMKRLPAIAESLQETVNKANKLLGSADSAYGGNSDFHRSLERMLGQLSDTANSIRVLADLLTRHPEALIRGRTDQGQE